MEIFCAKNKIDIRDIVLGTNFKKKNLNYDDISLILNTFYKNGGRCIDTARNYNSGLSEMYIGRWIKNSGLRSSIIIGTKAGHPSGSNNCRVTKLEVESDIQLSLKALKVDCIDLLWLHRDNSLMPVGEIIDFMNSFVKSGKIKQFGASNWKYKRILEANNYAKNSGQLGFVCSQIQWSVGRPDTEFYDNGMLCLDKNEYYNYLSSQFPLFAYSPQSKGIFYNIEKKLKLEIRQESFNNKVNHNILEKLQMIARKYDVPLSYPILSFIFSSPLNVVPIIGCNKATNLSECFSALDFSLQKQEYNILLDYIIK